MIAALLLAPLLVFHGNVALVEDVYRAVLDLPANAKATPDTSKSVAQKLRKFLHQSGYPLATVQARAENDQIVVQIDEGRLDKIIFLGGGAFETLRLRLDLHLHDDVYNQPELERQLKALSERLGLSEFAYEVVPVPDVEVRGVQLTAIDPLEELSLGLIRPGRPYELHILVQPGEFHSGLSPELQIDSLEGGGGGATYHSGRLFFKEDRFELGGRIAGALRSDLASGETSFEFTRALGEAQYQAPPFLGILRPSVRGRFDLTDRQRPDLALESFRFATLEGDAQLVVSPTAYLSASIGAGLERRLLQDITPVTGQTPPMPIVDLAHTRAFGELGLQLTFDPQSLRRDRHHLLALDARLYGAPHEGAEGALHLSGHYQKMFPLGWHEFWVEALGISRAGFVLFPEEVSIGGDPLRGPFGAIYTRQLAALQLEFRYSLLRDVFKLGIFHNGVLYGAIDRATGASQPAVADSFGVGFHALIIDEFALDAYYGVGFATGNRFDRGASLSIRQAF